jgi:hypothetical protein
VGLERGPLNLVSTIQEIFRRNSGDSGPENREYGPGDPLSWPHDTLCPQKLALTSPTSGGCSVGVVRSRAKVTHFGFFFVCLFPYWAHLRLIQNETAHWTELEMNEYQMKEKKIAATKSLS